MNEITFTVAIKSYAIVKKKIWNMCDLMRVAVYLPGDPTHTAAATVCPEQHSSNCLFDGGGCGQEMLAACSER